MWSNRRSRRRAADPEAMLRAHRVEPRDEFVRELSAHVDEERAARRPTAWSRLAFAGAASTFVLGMFATVGGFGYVASGASATYSAAKEVVVQKKLSVDVKTSSAAAQYKPKPNAPAQNVAGAQTQQHQSAVAGVASAQTLPFTGISLVTTVLIGSILLALGLVLRRKERDNA